MGKMVQEVQPADRFGMRREDKRTIRNKEVIIRKWVCSREGFKKKSNEEPGSQRQK